MFNIHAVVLDNGTCPAEDFLQQLAQRDKGSHQSFVNILKRHAEHGEIKNKEKSRPIKGITNLFEFKVHLGQGYRLLYFYLSGRMTILTHGFGKGARLARESKKAVQMRDKYCQEKNNE